MTTVCVCLLSWALHGQQKGGSYSAGASVTYTYTATCGVKTGAATSLPFTAGQWNPVSGIVNFSVISGNGPGGGGTSSTSGIGGGGQASSGGGVRPPQQPLSGSRHCNFRSPCASGNQCCRDSHECSQPLSSSLDLVTGDYHDEAVDLDVPVPGGRVEVSRRYDGKAWQFVQDLKPAVYLTQVSTPSAGGTVPALDSADWDGITYTKETNFTNVNGRFTPGVNKLVWDNGSGEWKEFDAWGIPTSFGNRTGLVGRYLYGNGQPAGVVDRNGRQVLWFAYVDGQLTQARDAAGRVVTYEYTGGNLSHVVGAAGEESFYEWNGPGGSLSKKVLPGGKVVELTRATDGSGIVTEVKDNRGVTTFEYNWDEGGRQFYSSVRFPGGGLIERWFDDQGRLIARNENGETVKRVSWADGDKERKTTDARGGVTDELYDDLHRLLSRTSADGAKEAWQYDNDGNVLQRIDARGTKTLYSYKNNLPATVKEAAGTPSERVTTYEYDAQGNQTKRTVDGITVYTAEYDPITGLKTAETDGEGNRTEYKYDAAGNVREKRLKQPSGTPDQVWIYAYDAERRPTVITDPLGQGTTNYYDPAGNLTETVIPSPSMGEGQGGGDVVKRLFNDDAFGSILSESFYADGATTTLTTNQYDAEGRLVKRTDAQGHAATFQYDLFGHLSKTTDPNGNVTTYIYDNGIPGGSGCASCGGSNAGAGLLAEVDYPTYRMLYEYDAMNRKTKETRAMPSSPLPLGEGQGEGVTVTTYKYDAAGNLISQTDANGGAILFSVEIGHGVHAAS